MSARWWTIPLLVVFFGVLAAAILVAFAAAVVYPTLPSLETLTDYRPKIPLRVYSAEGHLIGEFGEERRAVVKINEVPLPELLSTQISPPCASTKPRAIANPSPVPR